MIVLRGATEKRPERRSTPGWAGALGAALLVAATLVLAGPEVALACSCLEPEPPTAALAESDAVFSGHVARVGGVGLFNRGSTIVATVHVQLVWKGPVRARLSVITESDGAACGYPFRRGQEVLIYAYEHRDNLETDICTRTAPLSEARDDLPALGEGTVPPSDPLLVRAAQRLLDRPLASGLALVALAAAAWWLLLRRRGPRTPLGRADR